MGHGRVAANSTAPAILQEYTHIIMADHGRAWFASMKET